MISVVVPAHNEAGVIDRCLAALTGDARPGELDVVVVCNGCSDGTASVARRFAPLVRVVETPVGSKPHALNLGDAEATSFPRFYVDADVELATDDLRRVAAALRGGDLLAAAPRLRLDPRGASAAVRSYHRVWARLPVIRDGLVGRGVYALSEQGRRRFGEFPDLMADDLFVHTRFAPGERASVDGAYSVVGLPRSLRDLVRRKSRVVAANRELQRSLATPAGESGSWLRTVRAHPELLPDAPTYLLVTLLVRATAAWRVLRRQGRRWDRDDSARQAGQHC